MFTDISPRLLQVARLLLFALVLKVVLVVVFSYRSYLPPQFEAGFLQGRRGYFWATPYYLFFFLHIASGPLALLNGMVLMSDRFRWTFPRWHRNLGLIQILGVLLVLVPSGIAMSMYAETGIGAGLGFALLGVATGVCVLKGWQSAIHRRIQDHRRWMTRCFLLLTSAIVLRLMGGISSIIGIGYPTTYTLAAWASWCIPLALYELLRARNTSAASVILRIHR